MSRPSGVDSAPRFVTFFFCLEQIKVLGCWLESEFVSSVSLRKGILVSAAENMFCIGVGWRVDLPVLFILGKEIFGSESVFAAENMFCLGVGSEGFG